MACQKLTRATVLLMLAFTVAVQGACEYRKEKVAIGGGTMIQVRGCGCGSGARAGGWARALQGRVADPRNLTQLWLHGVPAGTELSPDCFRGLDGLVKLYMVGPWGGGMMSVQPGTFGVLPSLKRLHIANLATEDPCIFLNDTALARQITRLELDNVGVSRLCFADWHALKWLELRENHIPVIELAGLPLLNRTEKLTSWLRGNGERDVLLDEQLYTTIRDTTSLRPVVHVMNMDSLYLHCSIKHVALQRALKEGIVKMYELIWCKKENTRAGGILTRINLEGQ